MLTDDQVYFAARKYCELAGENADEMVQGSSPDHLTARWNMAAEKIRDMDRIVNAVGSIVEGYPE